MEVTQGNIYSERYDSIRRQVLKVNDFARRLKGCREKKKAENPRWTQRYVAEKIGMARTTYTAYENGTKMPPPDTINNIAILLDVSNDYLMGRTNEPFLYKEETLAQFIMLPVVNKISADTQTFSEKDILTYFPVEKRLIEKGTFVWLKIVGDSMINVGIRNGSKVLVRFQTEVANGEIAVVCVNQADAVLKKVYYNHEEISLVSENPSFGDQVYPKEQVLIKGKVIYVSTLLE